MSETQSEYKTKPIRITYPIVDTELRRVKESKNGYIEFYNDHVKVFNNYKCEERDSKDDIFEDVHYHQHNNDRPRGGLLYSLFVSGIAPKNTSWNLE